MFSLISKTIETEFPRLQATMISEIFVIVCVVIVLVIILIIALIIRAITNATVTRTPRQAQPGTIQGFVTDQVNGLIDILKSEEFRPCRACSSGTLNNINFSTGPGGVAWLSGEGCERVPPLIVYPGCVGCSWNYDIGINSLNGLGSLRITNVDASRPVASGTTVRIPFTVTGTASGVSINYTAKVQPCSPIAYITIADNTPINIPGTATLTLTGALVGTYDPATGLGTFSNKQIEITTADLAINIDPRWADIHTSSTAFNTVFNRVISPITGGVAATGSFLLTRIGTSISPIVKDFLGNYVRNTLSPITVTLNVGSI